MGSNTWDPFRGTKDLRAGEERSALAVEIAPSILSADFLRLGEQLEALSTADWLHLDIMDGHFVPNISFGADLVRQVRSATSLPLDVHLMVSDPDRYLDAFIAAGARIISVHVEACIHLHRTLKAIEAAGALPSVALNPATPLESVRWVLPDVHQVLLMTVNPGFGGQAFIPGTLDKIRQLRQWREKEGWDFRIQVDGGINADTARAAVEAGADVLVVGSALFGADGPRAGLERIRKALAG